VLIAAFHALTIVSARFHIPIEPLMAVWAACALTRRMTEDRWPMIDLGYRSSAIHDQPRLLTTSKASASISGFG
jgi:hypothetical protein